MLKIQDCFAASLVLLLSVSVSAQDQDPFRSQVRPTDPLTPIEQQETFRLPPGFQIELVAAEPDILKPMNLAFDVRGRLWASMSQEYPYAATGDRKPQDCIKILEDTTGDGRFDKIVTFADGLNIPIGLYPYKNGVIAWSIPYIWYLEDTNDDDKADKRTILYGPMGYERDTHGMNNGFTRGFDGWMYACHGFNNQTTVSGADGHEITMQSGNTYRLRLNGERIEQFTHGQVNPFGMAQDSLGNLFTADCHSKPIYQLVEGGYYPSFGKPHDGLGFVPPMMNHLHGSTAIAGVAIYEDDLFPPEYRGDFFSGNVMTSRINRNRIEQHGATLKAIEQPDFLTTSDPWFRPVDVQLGPDGALYVADFYNRIIGHYEVPLDHPGRDRTSGRIWRITHTDADHAGRAHSQKRLPELSLKELIRELGHPNQTRRMLVTDYLSDTIGESAIPALYQALAESSEPAVIANALWVLYRLNATDRLDFPLLLKHPESLVRLHAARILHEQQQPAANAVVACEYLLNDDNPFVRLAAVQTLGRHALPTQEVENLLLRSLEAIPADDVILKHTTRIALRDLFNRDAEFVKHQFPDADHHVRAQTVADITLGMKGESAGRYLLDYFRTFPEEANRSPELITHVVKSLPPERLPEVISLIRTQFKKNWEQQLPLLFQIHETLGVRRASNSPELVAWADQLFDDLSQLLDNVKSNWRTSYSENDPWQHQKRPCADGQTANLISSHPAGEQLTGSLISRVFSAPESFSFYLCGHRGFPNKPPHNLNVVTLKDAESGDILKSAYPPRNDTAQKIEWDLRELKGRKVYLQATDGDAGNAYAWLALGRFDPPLLTVPDFVPSYTGHLLAYLARTKTAFHLGNRQQIVRDWLVVSDNHPQAQHLLALAVLQGQSRPLAESLAETLKSPSLPYKSRQVIIGAILSPPADNQLPFSTLVKSMPSGLQETLVLALSNSTAGRTKLFELMTKGQLSPRLLQRQAVAARLNAVANPQQKKAIQELTSNLPDVSAELKSLIASRLKAFPLQSASLERGRQVFEKNCQNCHQIAGKGALVGPQLDGIGNRGTARLFEDTLDPNQNVDVAFHTMTIVTTEGKVITGLFRREEGDQWILADNKGKEFSVAAEAIEDSTKSPLSLMPENIARDLPPEDFFALMKYLLEQTAAPPNPQ
ncbi:MAG: HEAT repeat domain-containing protein [Planctomycetaceae bacterium]|nr:HEAT repeat domain-containing protein [Planctomycetaceae bacterium]